MPVLITAVKGFMHMLLGPMLQLIYSHNLIGHSQGVRKGKVSLYR
jgi:hypothetical protein